ncbi:efflux RND transporter periplasmic adaptor subunit [Aquincola sp. MAHUQ-54]|uniref:Efflux RND transporter periplasmic adaptor subunit n=1 Tax=Aquincola agrisoli TaxID=3119538 RepID=A0AAW9QDH0_9BURK
MEHRAARGIAAALAGLGVAAVLLACGGGKTAGEASPGAASAPAQPASAAQAALTVNAVVAVPSAWPRTLSANGSVAAWQESIVSAEQGGYRLAEVLVNVGDRVRRGQVLARMSVDTVQVELAQTRASLAEAEATLAEAQANAERARQLQTTGAISAQQINQYLTAEKTAQARLLAQRARLQSDELRLAKTTIAAPDDGVISARMATVGAVAGNGQELFRLIRGGRLEWRGEVTAAELSQVKPGMKVVLALPDGGSATGQVRMVAPTVDPQTRNGLVYVDLPAAGASSVRAGMFSRGEFELGRSSALTLPQAAVALRDGFQYVFVIEDQSRVRQTKVTLGRRQGDRVEVLSGLPQGARVVAAGVGFLADGDLVRVVEAAAPPASAAAR